MPAIFAPVISDGPIIIIVITILNQLPKTFLSAIQIVGGFFLLYISYGIYKSWKNFSDEKENPKIKDQTLIKAVVVNLLNPNPYIGWSLVMGPLLLKAWDQSASYGIALLASFYITLIVGLLITIIVAAKAVNKLGKDFNKFLVGLSALALLGFGIYSLLKGIKDLLIFHM